LLAINQVEKSIMEIKSRTIKAWVRLNEIIGIKLIIQQLKKKQQILFNLNFFLYFINNNQYSVTENY